MKFLKNSSSYIMSCSVVLISSNTFCLLVYLGNWMVNWIRDKCFLEFFALAAPLCNKDTGVKYTFACSVTPFFNV